MKSLTKLSTLALALFFFTGISSLQAQRFSAMANFSSFDLDRTNVGGTQIDYQGSTSMSANLRFYTKKKWAIRLGAGVDNLNYTVGDGVNTNYSARRQDTKGILGLEKHFMIANTVDIYPGVYVPVIVVGDDIVSDNYQNISNGNLRSGLGVVLGANIKLLKILRVGVEFDASYDNFKEGFWESVDAKSFAPVRGINHTTNFVVGIAF